MATLALGWMTHPPADFTGGAVSIGNFDGVHRGHQELVAACRHLARQVGGPAVLVTFDPPPLALLHPEQLKPSLTTPEDRAELLLAAGADRVVTLRTDPGLLALSPIAFFEDVIVGLFRAKAVVEGFNFRFGRGRAGDTGQLRAQCTPAGIRFEELAAQAFDGEVVSSSLVRAAIVAGDVTAANRRLGRRYAIRGIVEAGAKRGRSIGFPTANLGGVPTLVPKDGVYAVRAEVDGVWHPAAANVGPNPTFGEDARKIEVHLIGFSGDLYGRPLRVEFVRRLRDTRTFTGIAELTAQLQQDVAAAAAAVG